MASSPLTIILQLISEQCMVELHSPPGRDTIFRYLADYVNTLSPIWYTLDNNTNPSGFLHIYTRKVLLPHNKHYHRDPTYSSLCNKTLTIHELKSTISEHIYTRLVSTITCARLPPRPHLPTWSKQPTRSANQRGEPNLGLEGYQGNISWISGLHISAHVRHPMGGHHIHNHYGWPTPS